MKKIILVAWLSVFFCVSASLATAQTTSTQTPPVTTSGSIETNSSSVTQSPTTCKQGETKYYTCPNGDKVTWCTCDSNGNGSWVCIISPENKCKNTCLEGQTKKYVCGDGKQVDWCTCDKNGKWECIISPENKCQTVQNCKAGCVCSEGITTCPTSDKSVTTQVTETSSEAQPTTSVSTISIEKNSEGNSVIKGEKVQATSSEKVKVVENKLYLETSDNKNEEVKIMPETASATAIEKLGEVKNIQIELKEVGKTDEKKPAYEMTAEKSVKILGLFATNIKITTEVNAQTGNITSVKKPWWSFLAW